MPDTSFANGAALVPTIISKLIFEDALKQSFIEKFVGKGPTALIQRDEDLMKEAGDVIKFGIAMKLTGQGKANDAALVGSEEVMTFRDYSVTVAQRRNAVRLDGKMTEKRSPYNLRTQGRSALAGWLAETMDADFFKAISGQAIVVDGTTILAARAPYYNATSNSRILYGGQTAGGSLEKLTSDAAIDSTTTNLFGPEVISWAKRSAKMASPKILPIRVPSGAYKGKDLYVMLIHPFQAKALRSDSVWLAAQRDANLRGDENPIFSGAMGIWDGVVIHEHENVITRTGAGGSSPSADAAEYFDTRSTVQDVCYNGMTVARAVLMGAQAAVQAWGQKPNYEEEKFDYNNKWGCAVDVIYGFGKPLFNSIDYGSICVDTAVVPD